MKLYSKYFDRIRIKPDKERLEQHDLGQCNWPDCTGPAKHPAPKGRGREGEYFHFCLAHVREYNKNYNFFRGMSDEDAEKFRESIATGHRPTWKVGVNAKAPQDSAAQSEYLRSFRASHAGPGARPLGYGQGFAQKDTFGLFGANSDDGQANGPLRAVRNLERKSLTVLNLEIYATAEEIKNRFKELVKRHHPDSSRGQGCEEKLREVIQAYNYLKQAGLC